MPSLRAGLLCDLARQEMSGKYIAVGVYTLDLLFPSFPSAGQFTLFLQVQFPSDGKISLNMRVRIGDTVGPQLEAQLDGPQDQIAWMPVPLPALSIPGETTIYAEQLTDEGEWVSFFQIDVRKNETPAEEVGSILA